MRKKTNTWSKVEGDEFEAACEGDETCLAWLDAREQGYTGSLAQYRKNQGSNSGWDVNKWVTTGTSVLGSLSDLFGKKGGNGSSAPPPPPAPTKSYTGLWIIGGVVVVGAIVGAIWWKNKK